MTGFPRIRVAGGPLQRGQQYGARARAQILRTREGYAQAFAAKGVAWSDAVAQARQHLPAARHHTPVLITELEGIADGAGLSFDDVFTMNCRTEILWRVTAQDARDVAPWVGECTAFALAPERSTDGQVLVGQNWDWLDHLADSVVLLEVERADGPNYVTMVEAGLLAKTTLTQAGIAIAINTLVTSLDGTDQGVPFHLLVRAIADADHVSDALALLAALPRASSGNYLLGARDGAVLNVETAPGDARGVHPIVATDGVLVHTNHFLRAPAPGWDLAPAAMSDSFVRFERMRSRLSAPGIQHGIAGLRSALADHTDHPSSICCHPDGRTPEGTRWATLGSAIMEPATGTLHLAEGAPCQATWQTISMAGLLSA